MSMCCFAHHIHTEKCAPDVKAVVTVRDHGCSGKQRKESAQCQEIRLGMEGGW